MSEWWPCVTVRAFSGGMCASASRTCRIQAEFFFVASIPSSRPRFCVLYHQTVTRVPFSRVCMFTLWNQSPFSAAIFVLVPCPHVWSPTSTVCACECVRVCVCCLYRFPSSPLCRNEASARPHRLLLQMSSVHIFRFKGPTNIFRGLLVSLDSSTDFPTFHQSVQIEEFLPEILPRA